MERRQITVVEKDHLKVLQKVISLVESGKLDYIFETEPSYYQFMELAADISRAVRVEIER